MLMEAEAASRICAVFALHGQFVSHPVRDLFGHVKPHPGRPVFSVVMVAPGKPLFKHTAQILRQDPGPVVLHAKADDLPLASGRNPDYRRFPGIFDCIGQPISVLNSGKKYFSFFQNFLVTYSSLSRGEAQRIRTSLALILT